MGTVTTVRARSVRRVGATVALGGVLLAGTAGIAHAAQDGKLAPGQQNTYATWFFGRTTVCVKNLSSSDMGYYHWWSSASVGAHYLNPGEEICETRSFAGFRVGVENSGPSAVLYVRFPIGP